MAVKREHTQETFTLKEHASWCAVAGVLAMVIGVVIGFSLKEHQQLRAKEKAKVEARQREIESAAMSAKHAVNVLTSTDRGHTERLNRLENGLWKMQRDMDAEVQRQIKETQQKTQKIIDEISESNAERERRNAAAQGR